MPPRIAGLGRSLVGYVIMALHPLSFFRRAALSSLAAASCLVFVSHSSAEIQVSVQGRRSPSFPRQYPPGTPLQFAFVQSSSYANVQWYHDDVPISGATAASFAITNLTAADSGNYQARATAGGVPDISPILTINVLPFPPSPVDPTFNASIPADLRPVEVFPGAADGSLIVQCYPAGDPYNSGTRLSVIRLNADGSRDPSVFLQTNGNTVLAVLPAGDLIMSQAPHRLGVDGTQKAFVLPVGFGATTGLDAALVQPDGKILVTQGNRIARLNVDASVDTAFTATAPPGRITGMRLNSSGRIVLSGSWSDPAYSIAYGFIHRLLPDGQDDPGFAASNSFGSSCDAYPLMDGSLLVRKYIFSHEGPFLAKLKSDGTADPAWTGTNLFETMSFAIDAANSRMFYLSFLGILHRAAITATGIVDDPTFYGGETYGLPMKLTPDGKLLAGTVRLLTNQSVSVFPAMANIAATSVTPARATTVVLSARLTGTGPFVYRWFALDGQPLPGETTSDSLSIPNFDTVNFGRYQLRVTGAAGPVLTDVVRLEYDSYHVPFLANLSGRAFVGTGDDTAIAGLAVKINAGALGLPTLLRGAGPALRTYGVAAALPNPVLNLYNTTGQLLANNDNWSSDPITRDKAAEVGAFPFGVASNDSAMLRAFGTGNTTLQLVDQSGASGVGLLEIYRIPSDIVPGEIMNLSLRARTGPGEKVATAGFVIVDPQGFGRPARVLLRVVGPALSQYGVAFPLSDPVLTLYKSTGEIVATNDNWTEPADTHPITTASGRVGAFALPPGSKDAAIVLDLPAGVYSLQATSSAGTPDTGVTLIEIYLVK
ncbi:MAG: hypothetical protein JWM88_2753 [Verrucomicrobia bacterium]|nr:hypothetical protein [Verrucomicrobiota bacterium]